MKDQDQKNTKVKFKHPSPDFIPYTCHYNESTLLLKNNHLLQTIKITGFTRELVGKSQTDLKTTIREAISNNIKIDNVAIYLHTIRRRKNLRPEGDFSNEFCKVLDSGWNKLHQWEHKFVNELYLTFIYETKPVNKIGVGKMLSYTLFSLLRHNVHKEIDKNQKELEAITNGVLSDLSNFGARKLGIYKRENVYYSQLLRFLSKIINLNQTFFPLKDLDASTDLIQSRFAFGSESYQIKNSTHNYQGSLFSIKEYSDLSSSLLDKFLQLPMEFIITQSLSFVDPESVIRAFKEYNNTLKIGGDKQFIEHLGIKKILNYNNENKTAFGRQQLLLNILGRSSDELQENVEKAIKLLLSFGITCVRENVYLESCFWSQLPGNFCHLIRRTSTETSRFGGFGSLSNFPAGSLEDNKWGAPISVFYTSNQTPYFFNFHHNDNGHTLILGPYGSGKTVLLNFLVAQTAKIDFNLYYFDFFNSSEIFVNALDGDYQTLMLRNFSLDINPFSILDSPKSREFLVFFLGMLTIDKDEVTAQGIHRSDKKNDILKKVVDKLFTLPESKRNIKSVAAMLKPTNLAEKISFWANDGKFAKFFDHQTDSFNIKQDQSNIYGFDLTNIAESKIILYPLISYFLNKIELESSNGKPSIIVLDEAWRLIDNPFLAPKLDEMLASFRDKNIVVIFASESIDDIAQSNLTSKLTHNLSTQIYLPNKNVADSYQEIFNLSDAEFKLMKGIKDNNRNFLLKHANEAVVAELDLSSLEDIIAILSSNEYGIEIMQQVKAKTNGLSKEWIPIYLDILKDIFDKDDIDFADLEEELLEIDIGDYRNRAAQESLSESQDKIKQGEITVESASREEHESDFVDNSILDISRGIDDEIEESDLTEESLTTDGLDDDDLEANN
ncbi:MAG: hypothetical protein HON23_03325 [Rickettsiales bacterium]|jgi:type IV secretion system protein VirB4|nr:hypothetical protein [Rickettsiales bacterium]